MYRQSCPGMSREQLLRLLWPGNNVDNLIYLNYFPALFESRFKNVSFLILPDLSKLTPQGSPPPLQQSDYQPTVSDTAAVLASQ